MKSKTPGRRTKPAELRKVHVNTSMTLEQREMFLTIGGSAWLQKEMDALIAFAKPFGEDWVYHPEIRQWSMK